MNKIAFGDNFRERDVGCQREIVKSLAEGRLPRSLGRVPRYYWLLG
jgi:hypothetical protein